MPAFSTLILTAMRRPAVFSIFFRDFFYVFSMFVRCLLFFHNAAVLKNFSLVAGIMVSSTQAHAGTTSGRTRRRMQQRTGRRFFCVFILRLTLRLTLPTRTHPVSFARGRQ
jgi:hypothetical protein